MIIHLHPSINALLLHTHKCIHVLTLYMYSLPHSMCLAVSLDTPSYLTHTHVLTDCPYSLCLAVSVVDDSVGECTENTRDLTHI